MKLSVKRVFVTLSLCLVTLSILAQEKTLQYYNTHENEILPDVQTAFRMGDYDRTLELCRWHYIIFGDNPTVELLREKSERCAQLTREMKAFLSDGKVKDAKQKATVILSINPNDATAKEVLLIEEPASPERDTVIVEPPVNSDEVVISPTTEETIVDQKTDEIHSPIEEVSSSIPSTSKPGPVQPYKPRTRFVVKAGAAIIDLKQVSQTIAPGGTIGVYDLVGGPVGGEASFYICPGLSAISASLFGADAFLVFRAAKNIYPKLGVGFFSYKYSETNTSTKGLCAGGGLTYMFGGHFCLDAGVKYYPKVCVPGTITVTTTLGASYEFPTTTQVLSGGIAPYISVGWAF